VRRYSKEGSLVPVLDRSRRQRQKAADRWVVLLDRLHEELQPVNHHYWNRKIRRAIAEKLRKADLEELLEILTQQGRRKDTWVRRGRGFVCQNSVTLTREKCMKIRQGDVLIMKAEKVEGTKLPHLILALGEVTGHSHRISEGEAELHDRGGTLYLRVLSESATLLHEEHKPLQIPQGEWLVRIQREYEPDGWRYVAD
jgi:hypothetical protein